MCETSGMIDPAIFSCVFWVLESSHTTRFENIKLITAAHNHLAFDMIYQVLVPSAIRVRLLKRLLNSFETDPSIVSLPCLDTVTTFVEISFFLTWTIIPDVLAGGRVIVSAPAVASAMIAKSDVVTV